MYEISLSVSACLRAGTRVDVAWPVSRRGFGGQEADPGEALALTPGGGRIGGIASGAANDALAGLAGGAGRLADVVGSDVEAQVAGLPAGGEVRCVLITATELPDALWERLQRREPVCLVARLDATERIGHVDLYDEQTISAAGDAAAELFRRGATGASVTDDAVVSVFFPVPRLVIVGLGPIPDALRANAGLLGWRCQTATDASAANGMIAALSELDSVVIAAHDLDLAGTALAAALRGAAGYIGSVGSRRMQESRAEWLAYRDVTDTSRVHGPAGLPIGARTPAEIAVAILAQALQVRSGPGVASTPS